MKHLKKILLCTLLIVVGLLLVKKLASSSKQQGQKTNLSGSRNMSSDEADSRLLLGERRTKESATDIIHRLLEEPENAKMFHEEFQNILASDFDEVMAYLNAMKFPDPNSDHSFNQVMYVAKNLDHFFKNETFDDTVAALESIRGAPFLFEGALQEIISNSVGRHEGRDTEQYAQIYQWIKNNPETDAAQNGGTVLGGMLYLSDPENGWKKAMDLPEGRIRREAITALLTQRYSDDLTEASTILSQIDITPDLDDAMANLVRYGIEQDAPHDVLVEWAVNITNEDLRLNAIRQAITSWQEEDPTALDQWIQETAAKNEDLGPYLNLFQKQAAGEAIIEGP